MKSSKQCEFYFYPNWGIFGFTYHRGYGSFGFINASRIYRLEDNGTPSKTEDDYISEREEYIKREVYGFELSIPSGAWNWKAEIAYNPKENNSIELSTRHLYPINPDDVKLDFSSPEDISNWNARAELNELVNWIREENDGELNYNHSSYFSAFGC